VSYAIPYAQSATSLVITPVTNAYKQ